MGYHGSNPKTTTSIDSVWHSYSGQSTPKSKLQKELNPKAHSFKNASRKIVK